MNSENFQQKNRRKNVQKHTRNQNWETSKFNWPAQPVRPTAMRTVSKTSSHGNLAHQIEVFSMLSLALHTQHLSQILWPHLSHEDYLLRLEIWKVVFCCFSKKSFFKTWNLGFPDSEKRKGPQYLFHIRRNFHDSVHDVHLNNNDQSATAIWYVMGAHMFTVRVFPLSGQRFHLLSSQIWKAPSPQLWKPETTATFSTFSVPSQSWPHVSPCSCRSCWKCPPKVDQSICLFRNLKRSSSTWSKPRKRMERTLARAVPAVPAIRNTSTVLALKSRPSRPTMTVTSNPSAAMKPAHLEAEKMNAMNAMSIHVNPCHWWYVTCFGRNMRSYVT